MTLILFRLYSVENGDGKTTEPRLIGAFRDMDAVKRRLTDEAQIVVTDTGRTPPFVLPLNRFAVYEQTGDTDGDGFPDGFKFSELYTASQPEPQAPTVRKGKRA